MRGLWWRASFIRQPKRTLVGLNPLSFPFGILNRSHRTGLTDRMPRLSWSLAAALSMSAIAVFRPDIGSKSLAAHAARSLVRVVESLSQRFHQPGSTTAIAESRVATPACGTGSVCSDGGVASESGVGDFSSTRAKYSGAPATNVAALPGPSIDLTQSVGQSRLELSPQTNERHWKDCAVAAICSGIPGPAAAFPSTPQAPRKLLSL